MFYTESIILKIFNFLDKFSLRDNNLHKIKKKSQCQLIIKRII